MTVDTLGAFVTTPEFFAGLTTGALTARTVRRVVSDALEDRLGGQANGEDSG